jgi:hypothetical protein
MTVKGESSLPQLPLAANLCLQLKTELEGNPTPPPTPPALQQEYTVEEHNTDKANQYQSGVNPQVGPAGAYHSRDRLTVVQNAPSSTAITDLGAGSIGDCNPSHPACGAGSLMPVEAAGTGLLEGLGGASQDTPSLTSGQELRTGLRNNTGNISYSQ